MKTTKQKVHNEVFLQIVNRTTGEEHMLKVPEGFRHVMDKVMNPEADDYRNSQQVLKIFCEEFFKLSEQKREEFELILNSQIVKTETLADMLKLLLQRKQYFILWGVDSRKALGECRIAVARKCDPDSWIAKSDFSQSKIVGEKVRKSEGGTFYGGHYIAMYNFIFDDEE